MFFIVILLYVFSFVGIFIAGNGLDEHGNVGYGILMAVSVLYLLFGWILFLGFKVLKPNEALVLTLFGKYVGTVKGDGFFFVNPFVTAFNPAAATKLGQSGDIAFGKSPVQVNADGAGNTETSQVSKKISLKIMTLSNSRQKVNDVLGNPVEIAVAVMWRVSDTAKAVFNVDNYKEYLSLQCDAAVRNVVKIYPYDVTQNVDTTGDG